MVSGKQKNKPIKINNEPLNGAFLFPNGDKYVGEYKQIEKTSIVRHGQGLQTSANGTTYLGNWENDKMNGNGRMDFPSGNTYVGSFVSNSFHGEGTYYWDNGSFYIGTFEKNRLKGYGKFTTVNGQAWVGEFIDNMAPGLKLLL